MLDRVFWSAKLTASPTIPESVRTENREAMPVIERSQAATSTIQATLRPPRTPRNRPGVAPAIFAAW